jgi:iduronate 2-sulfatase
VSLVDLYPTLTELCGVAAPDGLDGQSLVPLLREPSRVTDRKVVTVFDPGNVTLRTERWRYIRYADGSEELYDVDRDPNEWTNLSGDPNHESVLKSLRRAVPKEAIEPPPVGESGSARKKPKTKRSAK